MPDKKVITLTMRPDLENEMTIGEWQLFERASRGELQPADYIDAINALVVEDVKKMKLKDIEAIQQAVETMMQSIANPAAKDAEGND